MEDLNVDIVEALKYVGWIAVGLTGVSTLFTMRRARKWKPVGARLVVTAAVGTAITLGSLLWTHRSRVWMEPTLLLAGVGLIAGWLTARGLSVRRSSLGAVAKRSAIWAAGWGVGLMGIQIGAALPNLDLVAPFVATVGVATGGLLGVGVRLLAKKRKLPHPSQPSSKPARTAQLPPSPPANRCRSCRRPLNPMARFCDQCGVAVLQNAHL